MNDLLATWVFISVVLVELYPNKSWICLISVPFLNRWVAKLCLNMWGVTFLETHINNRQSNIGLNSIFESNEFKVIETKETTYQIKYADGTAFLNDYFTIMCFLPSWKELLSTDDREYFFSKLESNLNKVSSNMGGLNLTVPIVMKKIKKRL